MRVLFLDDRQDRLQRFFARYHGPVTIARSADQAKECLKMFHSWDVVFLDHDLNDELHQDDPHTNTGWDVARYIAQRRPEIRVVVIHATTAAYNVKNMKDAISHLYSVVHIPFNPDIDAMKEINMEDILKCHELCQI